MKKREKQKPTRAQTASSIGALIAATGLLLIELFVSNDELKGLQKWHLIKFALLIILLLSSFGALWYANKNKRENKVKTGNDDNK